MSRPESTPPAGALSIGRVRHVACYPRAVMTPGHLVLALLVYMLYSNLISISQAWIAQSRISLATGLWGVHALMLLFLLVLFYRRLMVYSLFRFLR